MKKGNAEPQVLSKNTGRKGPTRKKERENKTERRTHPPAITKSEREEGMIQAHPKRGSWKAWGKFNSLKPIVGGEVIRQGS